MTLNIPERYIFALNILLAALVIPYFAARSVSDMIKMHFAANIVPPAVESVSSKAPAGFAVTRARTSYNAIVERDVFNLAPAPEASAPVESEDLNVTLLGTSHLTGGARSFVIIQDQSGSQQLYRLGDTIPSVGRLLQIGKNRAIVEHNGHRVALEIPKDSLGQPGGDDEEGGRHGSRMRGLRPPVIRNPMIRPRSPTAQAGGVRKVAPNNYAIERSTVNSSVQNMARLFTEIRAVPVIQNGASNGFRLTEIQSGSIFQQIGLQDGDVLTTVSGQRVNDPAKAMQMLSTLQSRSNITLNLLRNGAPVQLTYTIH